MNKYEILYLNSDKRKTVYNIAKSETNITMQVAKMATQIIIKSNESTKFIKYR